MQETAEGREESSFDDTMAPALQAPPPLSVRLRYWAVVIAWMALISYLSTDAFSAANTHRYVDPLLRWLFPGISNPEVLAAHAVVRKSAHFGEFLVLGVLALWAQRAGRPIAWISQWTVRAITLVVVYASIDEIHQAFTSSRTPSFADTGVDVLGGAFGQLMVYLRYRFRSRR